MTTHSVTRIKISVTCSRWYDNWNTRLKVNIRVSVRTSATTIVPSCIVNTKYEKLIYDRSAKVKSICNPNDQLAFVHRSRRIEPGADALRDYKHFHSPLPLGWDDNPSHGYPPPSIL